jgi:hypothetical protein
MALVAGRMAAQDTLSDEDDSAGAPVAVPDSGAEIMIDTLAASDSTPAHLVYDSTPAHLVYDSTAIAARSISESTFQRYRNDPDYDYNRTQREPNTLWQRLLRWVNEAFESLFSGAGGEWTLKQWLEMIVGAAILTAAIIYFIKADVRSLFMKRKLARVSPFADVDEDIHEMDFDALIAAAVDAKQYRRAVRLLYLKGLKVLSDRGAIAWRKDKTNRDYLHDLAESALRSPFADATILFEYVWYGDMPLNDSIFRSIRENLEGFITAIDRTA